jgi:hypothetical protein
MTTAVSVIVVLCYVSSKEVTFCTSTYQRLNAHMQLKSTSLTVLRSFKRMCYIGGGGRLLGSPPPAEESAPLLSSITGAGGMGAAAGITGGRHTLIAGMGGPPAVDGGGML